MKARMKGRAFFCFVAMVLVSVVTSPAFGQNQFVKTLGGGNGDEGSSIVEVSDGGLVLTGHTYSWGAGSCDLLLAKFDGSGNHLWTRTLGGSDWDGGYSVVEVSDGGLVLTGHTYSWGAGLDDLLLAKFDGSGNHLWTRTLGGANFDYGWSVVEVSDSGLVVTGLTNSYGAGLDDLLLAKFDGSGNHLWTRTLGGTNFDYGWSVVEVSDSGLVVTGLTTSYGAGSSDLLLAKFDGSGNHLWTRTLGGASYDRGYSVVEVSDGGLLLTGETESYGAGLDDLLLAKFDGSGNHLWTRTLGGASYDRGYSVVEVSDGGLVLTGRIDSYGAGSSALLLAKFDGSGNTCLGEFVTPEVTSPDPTITSPDPTITSPDPTITSPDPTITSPDPTLTTVCGNQPPTAFIDEISPNPAEEGDTVTFSGHGTDPDGSVVGYYWSSSSAGSLSTDSSFSACSLSVGTDTIFFKVQDDDSTWSEEVSEVVVIQVGVEDAQLPYLPKELSLSQNYPNPFNPITEIKYALPKDCYVKLEIYNILGQKVATLVDGEQKTGYKTAKWDASSFSSGIYFYRLRAGDFVQTRKMVVLK